MLMNIDCSAIPSIKVKLTFDDGSNKERTVGMGDIIQVEFNGNGMRKYAEGKVIAVSANGSDPKGWYIIVDGSDDFDSKKARFAPTSILDIEILRKADTTETIRTPLGHEGIPFLCLRHGQLMWSNDGQDWHPVRIHNRYIIEDAEGGTGDHGRLPGGGHDHHRDERPDRRDDYLDRDNDDSDDDYIEESTY